MKKPTVFIDSFKLGTRAVYDWLNALRVLIELT